MHTAKLTEFGNSTGLILSCDVLAAADLQSGDEVRVDVRNGRIEITKTDDTCNSTMDSAGALRRVTGVPWRYFLNKTDS